MLSANVSTLAMLRRVGDARVVLRLFVSLLVYAGIFSYRSSFFFSGTVTAEKGRAANCLFLMI